MENRNYYFQMNKRIVEADSDNSHSLSLRQGERKYEQMHSLSSLVFAFPYRKEEINIRIKRENKI